MFMLNQIISDSQIKRLISSFRSIFLFTYYIYILFQSIPLMW